MGGVIQIRAAQCRFPSGVPLTIFGFVMSQEHTRIMREFEMSGALHQRLTAERFDAGQIWRRAVGGWRERSTEPSSLT
jgi:hypothetical protein